jgi:hypothetical protein
MTSPIIYGYLQRPYLNDSYLGGFVIEHLGSQVKRVIKNYDYELATQIKLTIHDEKSIGEQSSQRINNYLNTGSQIHRVIKDFSFELGSQTELVIKDENFIGEQSSQRINSYLNIGSQIQRVIKDFPFELGSQTELVIKDENFIGEQSSQRINSYLNIGSQIQRVIKDFPFELGSQTELVIKDEKIFGSEIEIVIHDYLYLGSQIQMIHALALGSQIRIVLYNTTKIRILLDFPSRGTVGAGNNAWGNPKGEGLNWKASSTLAGDFDARNLNTDIVEQVWRSNNALTATIACDTELAQGVAPDTLAILNHNLTTSAVVVFEGSNDSNFSSIGITIPIYPDAINAYYIAPTLPTNQYRYWRLNISDPTNPEAYLQVGTIVFGSAIIFQGEDIVDSIRRRTKHFSDKVETEGFSNVSNDRALKRAISLGFNSLDYDRGNYANLSGIFETARTSLKCLWIPDPQDPKRFAVFGKLVEIPEEEHINRGSAANLVSLQLEVDESL